MDKQSSPSSYILIVEEDHHQQRIDNFLFTELKGLPKSRIYRALRQGEVRVNKRRIKPDYKLQKGDQIRIPPFRVALPESSIKTPGSKFLERIEKCIILENNDFIVLNKPAGIAVHGGSGISFGIIETLRSSRPSAKFLELVHRLDRDTSGCLLIAKKSSVLKEVHALLVERKVNKTYLLLVAGVCHFEHKTVDLPLQKNILKSGERIVVTDTNGKSAKTIFRRVMQIGEMTLLQAKPITGRTHQIRVHAVSIGHPILGDEKYYNDQSHQLAKEVGINQLCLHSASLDFYLPSKGEKLSICAVLNEKWRNLIWS